MTEETKRKISEALKGRPAHNKGVTISEEQKLKISMSKRGCKAWNKGKKQQPLTDETREKLSVSIKVAMHRPEVRKKHLDALYHSKWIRVRTDKGQLELIEKWNRMGFKFEPNYQLKTEQDLFYIDGYDKHNNVVLEYDSQYHNNQSQKRKDMIRQNKIIDALKPKRFWRFNKVTNTIRDAIRKEG